MIGFIPSVLDRIAVVLEENGEVFGGKSIFFLIKNDLLMTSFVLMVESFFYEKKATLIILGSKLIGNTIDKGRETG